MELRSLFAENCPSSLIVALVSSEAYGGSPKKNPFNFHHYDLSQLSFSVEGMQNRAMFQPCFTQKKEEWAHSFLSLFGSLGVGGAATSHTESCLIDLSSYGSGYTMYRMTFDTGLKATHAAMTRKAQTRLTLRFSKPLPEAVTVLAYGTFIKTIQIDKARNVYVI